MLIPVTFNPSSQTPIQKLPTALAKISHDEVVLIELQGSLEVECAKPTDKNGQFVGKLAIDESGSGKATLRIGHHLLEGKIASLAKPLAILTRSTTDDGATAIPSANSRGKSRGQDHSVDNLNAMDCDDGDGEAEGIEDASSSVTPSRQVQWMAVGMVKRKIVFAKRPMPIVGRAS